MKMLSSSVKRLLVNFRKGANVLEFNICYSLQSNMSCHRRISCLFNVVIQANSPRYFATKSLSFGDCDFEYDAGHPVFKRPTKKEAIVVLVNGLGCDESEASRILKDFPKLKYLTSKDVENKIEFYARKGIHVSEIIKNPWMLWFKSNVIENKLKIANAMKLGNAKSSILLLSVPLNRLKELQSWSENDENSSDVSKIEIISTKLKCSPADLVYILSIHKFIDRIPYNRLITVIDILLDAGVVADDILKDIWVVRYSIEQVSNRIRMAKEGGIVQFKTWMVRCPEKTLNVTLRRQAEKQTLLGAHQYSAIQYLSSRLGVSQQEAKMMVRRHPQLRGVGAAKLCNTLDFLLGKELPLRESSDGGNAKFNRVQVWSSIRALCHSLDTMKERLVRLRALGYEPYTPSILYKSRRKFEEFVKKLEEKAEQSSEAGESIKDSQKIDGPPF